MFGKIFFSREAVASAPFAVRVGTLVAGFGAAVLAMDFPLVTDQAAAVGEAADFFAPWFFANVGPVVFISVFAIERVSIMIAR